MLSALTAGGVSLASYTVGCVQAARTRPTVDETMELVAAGGLWLCLAWLTCAVVMTYGAAIPGAVGRSCDVVATALTPWAVRRLVAAAIGVAVVAGPPSGIGAAAAQTTRSTAAPAAAVSASSWDTSSYAERTRPSDALPPLDRPAPPVATVTVEPGDCLWTIAARHLGPAATAAEIAAAWPRWYHANRELIGADPDLIHPGQRLAVPA